MTPLALYKHEDNTDVAIRPLKWPFFIPEKNGYKIKVWWYNIVNPDHVYNIGLDAETIFVKKQDMDKWKLFKERV